MAVLDRMTTMEVIPMNMLVVITGMCQIAMETAIIVQGKWFVREEKVMDIMALNHGI